MELQAFRSQFDLGTKILVTGHTGFKGTWLTLLLERLGYEVSGLSLISALGINLDAYNEKPDDKHIYF